MEVVAVAQAVLFRRMRAVMLRPHDKGLIATTLNFDYEVRSAKEAFKEIADIKIEADCSTWRSTSLAGRRAHPLPKSAMIATTHTRRVDQGQARRKIPADACTPKLQGPTI